MSRGDLVSIVEAALRIEESEEVWIRGVLDALAPELDSGFGVMIGLLRDANASFRVDAYFERGSPPGLLEASIELNRRLNEEQLSSAFHPARPVSTLSVIRGPRFQEDRIFHETVSKFGIRDQLGIVVADPTGPMMVVVASRGEIAAPTKRELSILTRIAAHLASAFRLRLAKSAPSEAVLSPSGKIEDAQGEAQGAEARESLRRAAIAIDRARGKLRRDDPDEALRTWTALVEGRWSLIDTFDRDGRRYVVAKKNTPPLPEAPLRALSDRERQVVAYAALGRSNKLIAYELGVTSSTVATHLAQAQAKLGFQTKAELLQAWAIIH
jgi:DNA-binding CsgD family transcriptional regulator